MAAIAGVLDQRHQLAEPARIVLRMTRVMSHRGAGAADASLVVTENNLALGAHTVAGAPAARHVVRRARSVHAVLDGTLRNVASLRSQLACEGRIAWRAEDAEVAVAAYEHWGLGFLRRLQGAYALALWDHARCLLILARDENGSKPLYYARHRGIFAFASEVKALTAALPFRRRIDPAALKAYLADGWVPPPHTLLDGLAKLEAGGALVVRQDGEPEVLPRPPVHWPNAGPLQARGADLFFSRLDQSIAWHCGGGADSAVLLGEDVGGAVLAALLASRLGRDVEAVTVCMPEAPESDVGEAVGRLAARLPVRHRQVVLGEAEALRALPDYIRHLDEPSGDQESVRVWLAARYLRETGAERALCGAGFGLCGRAPWSSRILPLGRSRAAAAGRARLLSLISPDLACGDSPRPSAPAAASKLDLFDRMGMAHGVEICAPFLERAVQAAAGRRGVPLSALSKRLPEANLPKSIARPRPPPTARWFMGSFGDTLSTMIHEGRLFRDGVLVASGALDLLAGHRTAHHLAHDALWRLLVLACWYEQFWVDGVGAQDRLPRDDAAQGSARALR